MTKLATNLVKGGSIDHFMVAQGIFNHVYKDGKITLLIQKLDTFKKPVETKLQKLQEAPLQSTDTILQQMLQFYINGYYKIPQQSQSNDTIIAGSKIPQLNVDHTLVDIYSACILPHKRAHQVDIMEQAALPPQQQIF